MRSEYTKRKLTRQVLVQFWFWNPRVIEEAVWVYIVLLFGREGEVWVR